jgi:uncharacterized protein with PQ loop repeat
MSVTPGEVEVFMSVVAVATNIHWLPQTSRLIKRKQSDDFSFWTTLVLLANNIVWFAYAGYIGSPSLTIQQGLTIIMLLVFGGLIIRYRTTPLLFPERLDLKPLKRKYTRIWEVFCVYGVVFPLVGLYLMFFWWKR